MQFDWTYEKAIEKADALKSVGETRLYMARDSEPRWDKITEVECGAGWRLDVPTSMHLIAHVQGLTMLWNVEFEPREANGSGQHKWDAANLRDIVAKMGPEARLSFAGLIAEKILPAMQKHTNEYREYLRTQEASEMGARSLLAFCSKVS